jgi:predicted acetyltransferase
LTSVLLSAVSLGFVLMLKRRQAKKEIDVNSNNVE